MKYCFILLSGLLLLASGCQQSDTKQKQALAYFDLKDYFEKEAARLTAKNPQLNKTVMINGSSEHKSMKISDWKRELSSFTDANINRASWKGAFQVTHTAESERYTTEQEKIPVKQVQIFKRKDQVYGLQIIISNSNSLYTSTDTLTYYPDSLYEVRKTQNIRLMAGKNYRITGTFR